MNSNSEQKGLVMHSTGSWYRVRTQDGEMKKCRIKGRLRNQGIRTTNPVAVGDHVRFDNKKDQTGVIKEILPRRNCIVRKAVKLSHHAHIIAANIDCAYLIVTLAAPPTSLGFIDRYLVTAQAQDIPVCIVFNKIDCYTQTEEQQLKEYQDIYQSIGYDCVVLSALNRQDIADFSSRLADKINVLNGHSGVGKSTLINGIAPNLNLKTAATSDHHKTGKHTTTFAEMFTLPMGGYIIDTPGIRGFGIVDIPKAELATHFPEMRTWAPQCRFANCIHINEPGCAVKEHIYDTSASANDGPPNTSGVPTTRYQNYLDMYHTDDEKIHRYGPRT